ncbi:MAG: M14 family zinc carboxypeptidase [Longimicrobiales bacterium]
MRSSGDRRSRLVVLALTVAGLYTWGGARAAAQAPPSPAEVLGYELGERFTDHAGVLRYMEALAAAAPAQVRIVEYGRTVEGRRLVQIVVARPDHLARLDEILDANRRLLDPELSETDARSIVASNPAVVYFSYGVHGNESSSSEAAMWTAWDLAVGAGAAAVVLDSTIVVIDPVVNPDGRDRYVLWYRQARGAVPNPDPAAREHFEPWPGGRFNHYLFDLNRDWSWLTQTETRVRIASWDRWSPQIHVDFHEMSANSTYFFFPAAEPINPIYPEHMLDWGRIIGRANAEAFNARGWEYFTGDTYDFFYPGYGDSWPAFMGTIGMTYEQAGGGRAGLVYRQADGDLLTLHDRAEHHRATSHATARAAALGRTALLLGYAEAARAVGRGEPDFLIVPGEDPSRAEALVALLQDQGVEVERAARAFRAEAREAPGFDARREFPAGTYRVRARQPRGRLAATLLQPETELDATFSYDLSAWSLPYAFGVETLRVTSAPDASWAPAANLGRPFVAHAGSDFSAGNALLQTAAGPVRPRGVPGGGRWGSLGQGNQTGDGARNPTGATYGYLVPPGFPSWQGVLRIVADGGRAIVMDEAFTIAGRRWPAGTIFLPQRGGVELERAVAAAGLGERAVEVATGLVSSGNDLGTQRSYTVELPRIAMISGEGISPTSYGANWFFFDHTLQLPFTALPSGAIASADLHDYDVIVMPEGRLEESACSALEAWVERGGTLVALGSGAEALAEPIAGIEVRERPPADSADIGRALRGREARELAEWEEEIPGTVLPVTLDPAHPLAFGAGTDPDSSRAFVLHRGGVAFTPSDEFETAAFFPAEVRQVSGVISAENLAHLAQGSWLATRRVGDGRVILFADDPLFRHFWYAGWQPYVNALLLGPKL